MDFLCSELQITYYCNIHTHCQQFFNFSYILSNIIFFLFSFPCMNDKKNFCFTYIFNQSHSHHVYDKSFICATFEFTSKNTNFFLICLSVLSSSLIDRCIQEPNSNAMMMWNCTRESSNMYKKVFSRVESSISCLNN